MKQTTVDADALVRWQDAVDRARCAKRPWLLALKRKRMSVSAHGWLRGAATAFYRALDADGWLRYGVEGEGWIVGDLHVENFGAWRTGENDVVFALNDLDGAVRGPWRYDLLRLTTSVLLGATERGIDGPTTAKLARAMLEGWRDALLNPATRRLPRAARRLVERVEHRSPKEFLDARTEPAGKSRRFIRGERYGELDPATGSQAIAAFTTYAAALDPAPRWRDMVFRVAGTGSLGPLRVAVLADVPGDAPWVFDTKEQPPPPECVGVKIPHPTSGADRVIEGYAKLLGLCPPMSASVRAGKRSMLVRRFSPQDDKLDLAKVAPDELDDLVRHLGALTGDAHRRGADTAPKRWRDRDLEAVLVRATRLAGLHVSAWLAASAR